MKLLFEDYGDKTWTFILSFGDRKLQMKYKPKTDDANWEWIGSAYGSMLEMEEAKRFLVEEKILPRLKSN
jgi:hypothetical protein